MYNCTLYICKYISFQYVYCYTCYVYHITFINVTTLRIARALVQAHCAAYIKRPNSSEHTVVI